MSGGMSETLTTVIPGYISNETTEVIAGISEGISQRTLGGTIGRISQRVFRRVSEKNYNEKTFKEVLFWKFWSDCYNFDVFWHIFQEFLKKIRKICAGITDRFPDRISVINPEGISKETFSRIPCGIPRSTLAWAYLNKTQGNSRRNLRRNF